jgi:hypothetical protein
VKKWPYRAYCITLARYSAAANVRYGGGLGSQNQTDFPCKFGYEKTGSDQFFEEARTA